MTQAAANQKFDVFISYAHEDADSVAKPLSTWLRRLDVSVWLDDEELRVGDSIRGKIDEALASSRYGVAILSKAFFAKRWPQAELGALFSRRNRLLPVWHEIDEAFLETWAPVLVDICATSTSKGLQAVADDIARAVRPKLSRGPVSQTQRDVRGLLTRLIADYRQHMDRGDTNGRDRIDTQLMVIRNLRPPITELRDLIDRAPFDRECAMALALLLGEYVADDDNDLAAGVIAELLRNPYGRVRYRCAMGAATRFADKRALTGLSVVAKIRLIHVIQDSLRIEVTDAVCDLLRQALTALNNAEAE